MTGRVSIDAPAKLNLRLVVLAREDSGYHQLETLFCAVGLADRIEIESGETGVALEVVGEVDTGPPEQNLVTRAANAFFAASGEPPAVKIRLEKNIPSGAGLGGGSSDAAATLRALNALNREPLSGRRLLALATELGSDVPFFLSPTPYALAWGRGERLLAMPPLPARSVLIVHPGRSIKTPAAFSRLAHIRGEGSLQAGEIISIDALRDWQGVRDLVRNDLELAAFERIKNLPNVSRALLETGASIAALTGSGACVFGIFADDAALTAADSAIGSMGLQAWRTHTLTDWPAPTRQD